MVARVPSGSFTVTHECGFTKTSRTQGLADFALRQHSCDKQKERQERAGRVEERKAYEGEKKDCTCKIARHEHGTRTAYVVDGCRCRPCIDASTTAEGRRRKLRAFGRQELDRVDAGPVREHMEYLRANGVSLKQLAKVTGLSASAVSAIRYGRTERGHDPYPRVTKNTAEKILAVKPTMDTMAPGRAIDSTGTVRRLQALITIGWSQARLAEHLGMNSGNFGTLMNSTQCTVKKALAVRAIYERSWNKPQTGHDWHSKTSATRARNYAAARGWLPPMAWDDDTIDDPATMPDLGVKDKLRDTVGDDVEFLVKTGASRDEIGQRLGRTWDTIERQLHRIGRSDLIALAKTDSRDNARQARKGHAA